MSVLHVTNGEAAGATLRQATGGDVLSWDDVLHDGPVPGGLDDDRLAVRRAAFLASRGWVDEKTALARLRRRDRTFADAARGRGVLLWFEHDVYDQLQLIQILERLRRDAVADGGAGHRWIVVDRHPDVSPFHGLGQLSAEQLAALRPTALPIPPEALAQAAACWNAFTGDDPRRWLDSAAAAEALPHLSPAMRRLCAELPGVSDGLGRTERFVLRSLSRGGPSPLGALFAALQEHEPAPYMGDWSFFALVDGLVRAGLVELEVGRAPGGPPRREDGRRAARLTAAGADVLGERYDRVALSGIDLALGGLRIEGRRSPWRWDDAARQVVAVAAG